ncbi:MAG: acyl-CoA/acyl-ACP dehydrogenase [Streptosporangiales bacterium]|nr:acyl-CoA/acyl-ACP dehydrogenase [Streptosporangiales bacterium]
MTRDDVSFAERRELRASVRSFFARYSPEEEVRRQMESAEGFDRGLWQRMAVELGLQSLMVPEEHGGSGFGLSEAQIIQEEAGRALVCGPLLSSSALAASLLLATGDTEACGEFLPGLCDGSRIVAVAASGWLAGSTADDAFRARAELVPGGYALTGEEEFILDAHTAGTLLVPAAGPEGPGMYAVDAGNRVRVDTLPSLDATRRLSTVIFDAAPGRLVGKPGTGGDVLRAALVPASGALAAELAGVARRALDLAVEYAKVREQFGRVIGSFQAIKQKCADVLLAIETATSAAYAAGAAFDSGAGDAAVLAHLALAEAAEAAVFACTESVEIHGGIGFTWEHPIHLYYKRAVASAALTGGPARQRALMLTALGR